MARTVRTSFFAQLPERLAQPRIQQGVVLLCAFGLYANTLNHQFALDDGLVLSDNVIVQKGIRGIPEILTKDSFFGSIGESAYLSGGRYRPLPLITYAIEVSFFGSKPGVHHLVNVLLYALTGLVLLRLLRRSVFPDHPMAAFAAALLFIFHPIHTEVVANIKSRDELLSLLFLLLTLHYLLVHHNHTVPASAASGPPRGKQKTASRTGTGSGGNSALISACLFFTLALLSKENGIVFLLIVPLAIYFFTPLSLVRAMRASLPIVLLTGAYLALRFVLLGTQSKEVTEVMDNPYLLATAPEKIATILFVFLKYIGLLLVPHPLTFDYSFNQIPYRGFGDPWVIASIIVLLGMLLVVVRGFWKKDVLAWCVVFFLATVMLVSGLFFNIRAHGGTFHVPGFRSVHHRLGGVWPSFVGQFSNACDPHRSGRHHCIGRACTLGFSIQNRYAQQSLAHKRRSVPARSTTSANSARANTYAGIAWIHLCDATNDPAENAHA
ncbi:MAG: DUF1736 domain-containing protein [Flavobacteriales bacterium]|nr:DUF1736 domain-containing protein [Flavobacteriales bacterium]